MSGRKGKFVAVTIALIAALGLAGWAFPPIINFLQSRRQYISIELEAQDPLTTTLPEPVFVRGTDAGGTTASMKPTGLERWIVYLVTGDKKDRIWAIDHLQFDFMQGGNEPL